MKYVDEFRDPARLRSAAEDLRRATSRPWTVMEICGGQTHTIARWALEDLVPEGLAIIHGPGCPVCVTPLEVLEAARELALRPRTVLCSFGDMLRVPGSSGDLLEARARGADVRVVISPLDAVRIAERSPERHVVFLGVGFETTAPATAMAIELARTLDLGNFSVLAAHVRVPPAIELLLASPSCRVQGLLAAGHVCTIAGTREYPAIAERFGVPIVVTGFEPLDILHGLRMLVDQLEEGRAVVENQYERVVRDEGNAAARAMVEAVFDLADRPFRGLGVVPRGGLRIRDAYARWDAEQRFNLSMAPIEERGRCRMVDVLQGLLVPTACPEFGGACRPEHPLGAPMVSTEGACAAYYRYRLPADEAP